MSKELAMWKEKLARKKHLESMVAQQQSRQNGLREKTELLKTAMNIEQKDVDRLEKGGLVAFFYEMIGKKNEKLEKERGEAYAARLKYNAAAEELESLENSLRRNRVELESLADAPAQYEKHLCRVLEEIKASNDPKAAQIMELEQRMVDLQSLLKELREAIAAGKASKADADSAKGHLVDAEDWGTWDMFGGGMLADIAKYDALDSAQAAINRLQTKLSAFRTELVDVSIEAKLQVTIDGFTEFADVFFDGFFADWMVMDQIRTSMESINRVGRQLTEVLGRLTVMETDVLQQIEACKERLSALAVGE